MLLVPNQIKVGDKVEARYIHTNDQRWFRGVVTDVDTHTCSNVFSRGNFTVKLDEGQDRKYVTGHYGNVDGRTTLSSNIELRQIEVVPDYGTLVDQDEKLHETPVEAKRPRARDAKGRFIKQLATV